MSQPARILGRILLFGLVVAAASPVRAEHWQLEEAVTAARAAARADRHQESIDAYRRAIELDPEHRRQWLPELADQLTWGGRSEEAVPLYQEALANATSPEEQHRAHMGLALALSWNDDLAASLAEYDALLARDPADREARLGRARVLSWMDRQGPALAEYERVLADHPDDLDARRGTGRVQSWRGRQRDASQRMREVLRDHPHDRQATAILAESLEWMGRPDQAERTLREQVAADPQDSRASALLDDLEFDQRPELRTDWRESHQSNKARITTTTLEQTFHLQDGRSLLGPGFLFRSFRPGSGPVDQILVNRPGFHAAHRFDDTFAWAGHFGVDVIDTHGASGDHVRPTYDTFLSVFPNDTLRFDLGSSRTTFDNEKSLRKGITATYANASLDVSPDELTTVSTRVSWGGYSDGNRRSWWQLETDRRLWHHPQVSGGLRYTGFAFASFENNGYFNPDRYHANEVLLRAWDRVGERFRWFVAGSAGYEIQSPGGDKPIWSAGASIAYELLRNLEIETGYDFFSSRTAGSSGFERGTGRLGLRHTF